MDPARISGEPQGDNGARAVQERPASGHHFENNIACGNARAHYGDQYGDQHHHYYAAQPGPPSLHSDEKANAVEQQKALKRLQEALCFPQMNFRYTAIQPAYSQTCRWFFETPEYTRWRDRSLRHEHHGLLWMKGKPGAGKSTIAKCAVEHAKSNFPGEKVIYFFFNARGENLEKSVEGMFRSLLHQMAPDCPRLLEAAQSKALQDYAQRGWPLDLLKTLFREAANQLSKKASLICYIDAIDEGANEDEVRDMIDLLDNLLETTVQNDMALLVYLASRHYPNISTSCSEEFVLENNTNHRNDITIYAQSKLRCRQAVLKESLIRNITQRSSGVFLWVVLVVRDLNKEIDRGNQHRLQPRLNALPTELDDLFRGIVDEANNDDRLLPALMWVLFAYKVMTPLELYCAILSVADPGSGPSIACDHEVDEIDDPDVARNYILSSSKGLLEIVEQSDLTPRRVVQFVHESIREYLLNSGMQHLDPALSDNPIGRGNLRLAQWCESYLRVSSEQTHKLNAQYGRDSLKLAKRSLPFLEYSLEGMLQHNDAAVYHGADVKVSFENILTPWLHLRYRKNVLDQGPTTLHILANDGYAGLVKQHLQSYPVDHLHDYVNKPLLCMNGTALHIALQKRHINVAELLLDHGAAVNTSFAGTELPLHAFSLRRGRSSVEMIKALLRHDANIDAQDRNGRCVLHRAVGSGNVDMVAMLLEAGANVNARQRGGFYALHIAVMQRENEMVEILLQHGAVPNAQNYDGNTALHLAVSQLDKTAAVVEILLRHGADPNARNYPGRSPLNLTHGSYAQVWEAVELLRQYGADPNARNSRGRHTQYTNKYRLMGRNYARE